jgi:hypothetical protein
VDRPPGDARITFAAEPSKVMARERGTEEGGRGITFARSGAKVMAEVCGGA